MSKLDYHLGSTIDDSMAESIAEEKPPKAGLAKKKKSRVGSGSHILKSSKGRFKHPKNADLIEDCNIAGTSVYSKQSRGNNRTKYDSKSPFGRGINKNKKGKNNAKDEKSTDADEDSKTWGLMGRAIDKRNSTKFTHHTNSEEESSWVGLKVGSSNEKTKKTVSKIASKRTNSKMRKQKIADQKIQNKNPPSNNKKFEEEKIEEEIEAQESYSYKFDVSNQSPNKKNSMKEISESLGHNEQSFKTKKSQKAQNMSKKCILIV